MATQPTVRPYGELSDHFHTLTLRLTSLTFTVEIGTVITHLHNNHIPAAIQELEAFNDRCNGFLQAVAALLTQMQSTEAQLYRELLAMRQLALTGAKHYALSKGDAAAASQINVYLRELEQQLSVQPTSQNQAQSQ